MDQDEKPHLRASHSSARRRSSTADAAVASLPNDRKHTLHQTTLEQTDDLTALGYTAELRRNRSMLTLLFQSLAIAAIPYGEGSPLLSAIYGGGPLAIFVGWIVACVLDECVALSLAELASRFPTSGGPQYWVFQLLNGRGGGTDSGGKVRGGGSSGAAVVASFLTGWVWLVGNWTITLSVNFGAAALISGTISMYHDNFVANDWQLLLIFFAFCLASLAICIVGNHYLPMVDTICAAWTALSIVVILIALSVEAKAGRHSAAYALGHYDTSFAGWGGFTFFIGLLPAAYTFSAIGMISSMAEEVAEPAKRVPTAISLCVPVGGTAGLLFILPICFTLPPLEDILGAPSGQALPYIFHMVMGSPGGALGLMFLVLGVTFFCSISITVAASRTTWAMARDDAIPFSRLFSKVSDRWEVPIWSLVLVTVVQMLLGLINLGSTSAFTAFVSVGVIALALGYAIPIAISVFNRRREVSSAVWNCGPIVGPIVNGVALLWITFELVLFSMPTALPVTEVSMNYASVVLVGFFTISLVWYGVSARKTYKGPPASEGIAA